MNPEQQIPKLVVPVRPIPSLPTSLIKPRKKDPLNPSTLAFVLTIAMIVLPLLSLLLATTGFAIPHHYIRSGGPVPGSVLQSELPSNQAVLVAPDKTAKFVAVGAGNQNYTCTSAGTYSSIGAVAELYDITPLYGLSKFSVAQQSVYDFWTANQYTDPLDPEWTSQVQSSLGFNILGPHTFVEFDGALHPEFDFSQSTNDASNFVIAKKVGDIPDPIDPGTNVDWLQLKKVDGSLACTVFRVATIGGQPPTSCTGTHTIQVKYAAQYWFF